MNKFSRRVTLLSSASSRKLYKLLNTSIFWAQLGSPDVRDMASDDILYNTPARGSTGLLRFIKVHVGWLLFRSVWRPGCRIDPTYFLSLGIGGKFWGWAWVYSIESLATPSISGAFPYPLWVSQLSGRSAAQCRGRAVKWLHAKCDAEETTNVTRHKKEHRNLIRPLVGVLPPRSVREAAGDEDFSSDTHWPMAFGMLPAMHVLQVRILIEMIQARAFPENRGELRVSAIKKQHL